MIGIIDIVPAPLLLLMLCAISVVLMILQVYYARQHSAEIEHITTLLGTMRIDTIHLVSATTPNIASRSELFPVVTALREAKERIEEKLLACHKQTAETTELLNSILAREKAHQRQLLDTFKILSDSMHRLAQGALDVDVDPEKGGIARQLFEDYNSCVQAIRNIVFRILESVSGSALMSEDIAHSAQNILQVSKEQEELSSTLAESAGFVSDVVTGNTKSTTQTAEIAKRAMAMAQEGVITLAEAMRSNEHIVQATRQTGDMLSSLARNIEDISTITATINEIADQTNLLALNAAIEAARAGEQGRGFAVVADEVRKLAERTTQATKEISQKIATVRKDSFEATKAMQGSMDAVQQGSQLNTQVERVFGEILSTTKHVVDNIAQVAIATEEQYATVQAIIEQIHNLAAQAKDANAKISEISSYAENLMYMNEHLKESVDFFKFDSGKEITASERPIAELR
ncbi:MAG: methyl-accepting chemotaxis protein [Bacteroidota bacterium]|nr:methyl-accepting chemotaxis protein [Candidatus Kapabacteria bacterium]MDW8219748.1 methyl-accepting chemotaxis protein [Bacteroidota bacterium]